MTPTPDTALAARLLPCPFCGEGWPLLVSSLNGKHVICKSCGACAGVVFKVTADQDAKAIAAWNTRDTAGHNDAVQAAVAKAVEAERDACADLAVNRHWHWGKMGSACLVDDDASACADIAAAIRARKGDAL